MALDFAHAAQLFMGTEEELAAGLGLSIADLRAARAQPQSATRGLLSRLGQLLEERGRGMARVGQMLQEDNERQR